MRRRQNPETEIYVDKESAVKRMNELYAEGIASTIDYISRLDKWILTPKGPVEYKFSKDEIERVLKIKKWKLTYDTLRMIGIPKSMAIDSTYRIYRESIADAYPIKTDAISKRDEYMPMYNPKTIRDKGYDVLRNFNVAYIMSVHDSVSNIGDEHCVTGVYGLYWDKPLIKLICYTKHAISTKIEPSRIAAKYITEILQCQPFQDCNHRTGFAMMQKILDAFRFTLNSTNIENKELGIKIYNSDTGQIIYNENDVYNWIKIHLVSYKSCAPNSSRVPLKRINNSSVESLSQAANSSSDIYNHSHLLDKYINSSEHSSTNDFHQASNSSLDINNSNGRTSINTLSFEPYKALKLFNYKKWEEVYWNVVKMSKEEGYKLTRVGILQPNELKRVWNHFDSMVDVQYPPETIVANVIKDIVGKPMSVEHKEIIFADANRRASFEIGQHIMMHFNKYIKLSEREAKNFKLKVRFMSVDEIEKFVKNHCIALKISLSLENKNSDIRKNHLSYSSFDIAKHNRRLSLYTYPKPVSMYNHYQTVKNVELTDTELIERITNAYIGIYFIIKDEYNKYGTPLKQYHILDRRKILRFFKTFLNKSDESLFETTVKLIDILVRMQSLPNANHRTTIYFIKHLLKANGIMFPNYDITKNSVKWSNDIIRFAAYSRKCLIEIDDSHTMNNYRFDKHCHQKHIRIWLKEMLIDNQSGKWSNAYSVRELLISFINSIDNPYISITSESDINNSNRRLSLNTYPKHAHEFLKNFNETALKTIHRYSLIASGELPYNIKNTSTVNHIVWELNDYGKRQTNLYDVSVFILKNIVQMSDSNKPFENGNHRTAWGVMNAVLQYGNIYIDAPLKDRVEFGRNAVFMSDDECINWLKNHSCRKALKTSRSLSHTSFITRSNSLYSSRVIKDSDTLPSLNTFLQKNPYNFPTKYTYPELKLIDVSKICSYQTTVKRNIVDYYKEKIIKGLDASPIQVIKHPKEDRYVIINGNHRLMAVRELGHKEIAALIVDDPYPEAFFSWAKIIEDKGGTVVQNPKPLSFKTADKTKYNVPYYHGTTIGNASRIVNEGIKRTTEATVQKYTVCDEHLEDALGNVSLAEEDIIWKNLYKGKHIYKSETMKNSNYKTIHAITYSCSDLPVNAQVGLCKSQDETDYWRHEWSRNNPRLIENGDGTHIISGKVIVLSNGIDDYSGDSNDFKEPLKDHALKALGHIQSIEVLDNSGTTCVGLGKSCDCGKKVKTIRYNDYELYTDKGSEHLFMVKHSDVMKNNGSCPIGIPANGKIVILWAQKTCSHCHEMVKFLPSLPVANMTIDVQNCIDFAARNGIISTPTLDIYVNGIRTKRQMGAMTKEQMLNFIK